MGISLLSPMYLFGLAFLGLPLAIHLLSRRSLTEREFSDIRFIREAITRRHKEIQLEDRRLLLLRMALIGLLSLALAKPVLKTSHTAVARSGEKTSLVFVVDNSFSMATSDNGVVRMDRATAKIRSLLSFYGTGDEVSLIAASERPQVLLKRADAAAGEFPRELEQLAPSFFASNLASGLRLAVSILEEVDDKKREIYLVTDMQALGWEDMAYRQEELGKLDIDLFLVDVGTAGQRNLAITDVRVEPATESERGNLTELMVSFRVEAFGAAPREATVLREAVGGQEEASAAVQPRVGQPTEQTFTNWVQQEGTLVGYGELSHDPLTVDNRRFFVHGGGGESNILLVEGNPPDGSDPRDRPEGFFLRKALEVLRARFSLNLRQEEAAVRLDRVDFPAYHLVILVDVPMITEHSALALRKYVEEGGNAIMFLGPQVLADDYNTILYPDLLPFRLLPNPRIPAQPSSITRRLPDHPLFTMFNEEKIDLSEPNFTTHWDLEPEEGSSARPLAWYSDGGIAMLESHAGNGRMLILTSSPGPPWSNDLPGHLVFVPLVGELMNYLLAADAHQASVEVGDTVALRVIGEGSARGRTVSIHASHPNGETETLAMTLSGGSGRYFFGNLKQPGVYRFAWSGEEPAVKVAPEALAVNPDARESDLTTIDPGSALDRISAFRTEALEPSAIEAAISEARKGRPVWDYLLLIVLGLLAVEMIYGNRVRRAHQTASEKHPRRVEAAR